MPPRPPPSVFSSRALRQSHISISRPLRRHWYSAEAPLIVATDLPAPNTGHIRILELNRPAARNAISRALLYSLRDHIDAVHAQYDSVGNEVPAARLDVVGGAPDETTTGPTRALIIASAVDSSFCAGADLKERKGFTKEE